MWAERANWKWLIKRQSKSSRQKPGLCWYAYDAYVLWTASTRGAITVLVGSFSSCWTHQTESITRLKNPSFSQRRWVAINLVLPLFEKVTNDLLGLNGYTYYSKRTISNTNNSRCKGQPVIPVWHGLFLLSTRHAWRSAQVLPRATTTSCTV